MRKAPTMVTRAELAGVWGDANFGDEDRMDTVRYAILKYASGYHSGFTAQTICQRLGLLNKALRLTPRGRYCLYEWFKPKKAVADANVAALKAENGWLLWAIAHTNRRNECYFWQAAISEIRSKAILTGKDRDPAAIKAQQAIRKEGQKPSEEPTYESYDIGQDGEAD